MSDEQPLMLQPFVIRDGQTILGPERPTHPHEFAGCLIDYQTRSLIIVLYNQAMMDPERDNNQVIPCVSLAEKDIVHMISGLQQALQILSTLPVKPE
jgi:hypothetical protein